MRVCWIVNGDERFGVKRAVDNLMEGVAERGHDVGAIAVAGGRMADELRERGRLIAVLDAPTAKKLSGSFVSRCVTQMGNLRRLRAARAPALEVACPWKPDVMHALWPSLMPLAGSVARSLDIPCIWEMCNVVGGGYPFDLNKRLLRHTCRRYGVQPLANSGYTAQTLAGGSVRPIVFYLGVDARHFDPDAVEPVSREELGLPVDAPIFGVFARIDSSKGQRRLTQALSLLPSERRPHLLFVGGPVGGPEAQQVRRIAQESGFSDLVHLHELVPDPERYYGSIDVAVNALVGAEAYGLSVIEAMMMQRPVLVHALGGPAETVLDGRTGWHVREPTPEAFAAGIERALSDRDRWPQMGQEARRHAVENFSQEAVTSRYLSIVRDLIERRRPQ